MPYLQSLFLEAVSYDEETHCLSAKFRADGRERIYENVPQEIYDSLIFADSIGGYFHDHIEGVYPVHEVSDQPQKPPVPLAWDLRQSG